MTAAGVAFKYDGVDNLIGGAAGDAFNVRSLGFALSIDGGSGDDVVSVAGDAPGNGSDRGAITGSLVVYGGDGNDSFRFNGTAANETVTARVAGPTTGDVLGLGLPAGVTVAFASLESFLFDGRGGTNTFTALDISGASLGTPTEPASGIVYTPTGPTGGGAPHQRRRRRRDRRRQRHRQRRPGQHRRRRRADRAGHERPRAGVGLRRGCVGDGRDRITVTETSVTFVNAVAGPLLPLTIGYTNGFQTFNTLYVAGGNEAGNEGDTIILPTSLTSTSSATGCCPVPPRGRVTAWCCRRTAAPTRSW